MRTKVKAPPHKGARRTRRISDGRPTQQGQPDHFDKLMESPCTNHAYTVKHIYKDCELLKRFLW